jgi:hypothetical protein
MFDRELKIRGNARVHTKRTLSFAYIKILTMWEYPEKFISEININTTR